MAARVSDGAQLALVILLVTLAGCSDGSPFDYVKVNGTLAYENGEPLPKGGLMLLFVSLDAEPIDGASPRPAKAGVDAQGRFESATSHKYGDGLIPGRHKVSISYATDDAGNFLVPKEFTDIKTTPLVIETGDGVIDIRVPRP